MVADRTIDEVASELRVSRSTLDGWLGADMRRPIDDRHFQFHAHHGRKRIWTDSAFRQLREAIERESQPGGRARAGELADRSARTRSSRVRDRTSCHSCRM